MQINSHEISHWVLEKQKQTYKLIDNNCIHFAFQFYYDFFISQMHKDERVAFQVMEKKEIVCVTYEDYRTYLQKEFRGDGLENDEKEAASLPIHNFRERRRGMELRRGEETKEEEDDDEKSDWGNTNGQFAVSSNVIER